MVEFLLWTRTGRWIAILLSSGVFGSFVRLVCAFLVSVEVGALVGFVAGAAMLIVGILVLRFVEAIEKSVSVVVEELFRVLVVGRYP